MKHNLKRNNLFTVLTPHPAILSPYVANTVRCSWLRANAGYGLALEVPPLPLGLPSTCCTTLSRVLCIDEVGASASGDIVRGPPSPHGRLYLVPAADDGADDDLLCLSGSRKHVRTQSCKGTTRMLRVGRT